MKKIEWWRAGVIITLAALCGGGCGRGAPPPDAARALNVTTARPELRMFRNSLRVQGTVEARHRAGMAAQIGGVVEVLFADEGASVRAGDPLFQTDKANLQNRVQIERDNMTVAAAARAEAVAASHEAEAAFHKADLDYTRARKLFEVDKAITLDALERAESAFKRAEAGLARAKSSIALAAARELQAASALSIAEKQLADSLVKAPFDGVITHKRIEPGEYAKAGDLVVTLEDPATLEVSFVLAAQHYAAVRAGDTRLRLRIGDQDRGETVVRYKAPAVNPLSRTFEIKADLPAPTGFALGMLCDLEVILAERAGLGIPDAAVSRRGEQAVVFVAAQGQAMARTVTPGWQTGGFTELVDSGALSNAAIVVDGVSFLNDGDPLRTE